MADEKAPQRTERTETRTVSRTLQGPEPTTDPEQKSKELAEKVAEESKADIEIDEAGVMHGTLTVPVLGGTNPTPNDEPDEDNPDDGVDYKGVDPQFKTGRPGGAGD